MKTSKTATKPRFNYITVASVISAFAVILLHTNSFWNYGNSPRWEFANIINCVFTFAVPVFFMISGATLIDYSDRYDTKSFFKKRLKKTLIPWLFWSLAAAAVHAFAAKDLPADTYTPANLVAGIFCSKFIPIFWFFPPLFGLYLCMPLLTNTKKSSRKSLFHYLIAAIFIINALIPSLIKAAKLPEAFTISLGIGMDAFFYAIVGYYIANYKISKRNRIILYILGLISVAIAIVTTSIDSHAAGAVAGMWRGLDKPTYMLYAPAIFVAIKQLVERFQLAKRQLAVRFFAFFSRYTFAIYLLHWFFLAFTEHYLHPNTNNPLYFIFASVAYIIGPCIVAFIVRKIPVVRALIPD